MFGGILSTIRHNSKSVPKRGSHKRIPLYVLLCMKHPSTIFLSYPLLRLITVVHRWFDPLGPSGLPSGLPSGFPFMHVVWQSCLPHGAVRPRSPWLWFLTIFNCRQLLATASNYLQLSSSVFPLSSTVLNRLQLFFNRLQLVLTVFNCFCLQLFFVTVFNCFWLPSTV